MAKAKHRRQSKREAPAQAKAPSPAAALVIGAVFLAIYLLLQGGTITRLLSVLVGM